MSARWKTGLASIPDWVVDPLICTEMSIGRPQVDFGALSDRKRLVTPTTAPNSPSENGIAREEVDEAAQRARADLGQADEPDVRALMVERMNDMERAETTTALAQILMEAAGLIIEELDYYQRRTDPHATPEAQGRPLCASIDAVSGHDQSGEPGDNMTSSTLPGSTGSSTSRLRMTRNRDGTQLSKSEIVSLVEWMTTPRSGQTCASISRRIPVQLSALVSALAAWS